METKLEQIAAKAVKQRPKSVVREIRTPRSVGTGGRRLPPVTRWRSVMSVPTAIEIAFCFRIQADRVRTPCLAASSVVQVAEDYERRRVTPRIAPIDHAGILAEATRSVRPVRSDRAQGAGLLSPVRPSPPPSICQMRQG